MAVCETSRKAIEWDHETRQWLECYSRDTHDGRCLPVAMVAVLVAGTSLNPCDGPGAECVAYRKQEGRGPLAPRSHYVVAANPDLHSCEACLGAVVGIGMLAMSLRDK